MGTEQNDASRTPTIDAYLDRWAAQEETRQKPLPLTMKVPSTHHQAFVNTIGMLLTELRAMTPPLRQQYEAIYVARHEQGKSVPTQIYWPTADLSEAISDLGQAQPGDTLLVTFRGDSVPLRDTYLELKRLSKNGENYRGF